MNGDLEKSYQEFEDTVMRLVSSSEKVSNVDVAATCRTRYGQVHRSPETSSKRTHSDAALEES